MPLLLAPLFIPIIAFAYNSSRTQSGGSPYSAGTSHAKNKNFTLNGSTATGDAAATTGSGIAVAPVEKPPVAIPPAWSKLPLYVDPANDAVVFAAQNPTADGAALIKRQGMTPIADWFGDWDGSNVQTNVNAYVTAATQANAVPVVVLYNIPNRDCGLYSSGGANNDAGYLQWIKNATAGMANRTVVVILEPDALAGMDCLSQPVQDARTTMLSQAVTAIKQNKNAAVYLDAGNPEWRTATVMASRLKAAGVAQADGFSLNVSNYVSTAKNQAYGDQISKLIGYKHYVIDTSRNGSDQHSPDDWCNSATGALGAVPTLATGNSLNDALLWIKVPWESDGDCNGAPAAGANFWQLAVSLARNAGWR